MKIISIVANNPIFIELQYKTLKKFIDIEYEYIIFNDGKDWADITNFNNPQHEGKQGIIDKCKELGITYINIPNNHHKQNRDASRRHVDSLNFVLNFMKHFKDEYLMLDSDMFIIDKLDFNIYRKFNCACVIQTRDNDLNYIWPNIFYINMNKIRNEALLDLSIIPGGDTGSASSKWLKSFNYTYPTCESTRNTGIQNSSGDDFYYINHLASNAWNEENFPSNLNRILLEYFNFDVRNTNNTFFSEIYDNKILHYRAGTNWMNESKHLHNKNISKLISVIDTILM